MLAKTLKRLAALALAAAIALVVALNTARSEEEKAYVVVQEGTTDANVFSQPSSITGESLMPLRLNDEVVIVAREQGRAKNYVKVRVAGVEGYMKASAINKDPAAASGDPRAAEAVGGGSASTAAKGIDASTEKELTEKDPGFREGIAQVDKVESESRRQLGGGTPPDAKLALDNVATFGKEGGLKPQR
jgi:hypothetical protein